MMMVDSIILTDQLNIGNNKNQVIFINYCHTHKIYGNYISIFFTKIKKKIIDKH